MEDDDRPRSSGGRLERDALDDDAGEPDAFPPADVPFEPQPNESGDDDSTDAHRRKMWAGQSNILVAVRARPLLQHDNTVKSVVRVLDQKMIVVLDPSKVNEQTDVLRANRSREKRYAFDHVFSSEDDQQTVFNRTTKFLIQGVLDGFNATVFAYGQTGAGKTYTMIGNREQPGIMVLTLQELFHHSHRVAAKDSLEFKVTVSFLEVYNENIRDLLSDGEEFLDLREDPMKGPVVSGITEVEASSAEEIMELLHRGNSRRSQHPTAANEVSSRSHAVLQVVVETRERAEGVERQDQNRQALPRRPRRLGARGRHQKPRRAAAGGREHQSLTSRAR